MIDLENMSLDELKSLRKNVDATIASFELRKKAKARAELEQMAKELGYSLDEILRVKARSAKAAPKYRNPEDPTATWSGRGRRPKWLEEALNAGADLGDFLIK